MENPETELEAPAPEPPLTSISWSPSTSGAAGQHHWGGRGDTSVLWFQAFEITNLNSALCLHTASKHKQLHRTSEHVCRTAEL